MKDSDLHVDEYEGINSPDPKIGKACLELIARNEKISFRSVAETLNVAHTTLSRDKDRRKQILNGRKLQKLANLVSKTQRGKIHPDESIPYASVKLKVERLEAQRELLVASHKAMLRAVGEMGGTQAWLRFYSNAFESLETLKALDAIPSNATSHIDSFLSSGSENND